MAKVVKQLPGGTTSVKFDTLEELQEWAKENVKNKKTLELIMKPVEETSKK